MDPTIFVGKPQCSATQRFFRWSIGPTTGLEQLSAGMRRGALLPMAARRLAVAPSSAPVAAAGALAGLCAGGGRARFSNKRRERYGSESEARQTTRLLSFAKKKQQAQLSKLKLALAQEEIARATLDTGTSVASAGVATTADAPAADMTRARRAKLAKQERIKHLPLFRPGSALLSHFGERTLGHYEHLPLARFEGDVAVIHSASEEQPHAEYLRAQRVRRSPRCFVKPSYLNTH